MSLETQKIRLLKPSDSPNWHVKMPDGRLKSTGQSDKAQAQLHAMKVLNLRSEAARLETELLLSVGELVLAYSEVIRRKNPSTHKRKWKTLFERLNMGMGHIGLIEFTHHDAAEFHARRRAAGIADPTIRQDLSMLRRAWKWAKSNGRTYVECPSFELPANGEPATVWLTKEEARALFDACEHLHEKLFIRLGFATGGRHEAILELEWHRVDIDRGIVDLRKRRETEDGRKVSMKGRGIVKIEDPVCLELLASAKAVAETSHVIEYRGKPIAAMQKAFKRLVTRSGIRGDATPHCMRHSAATWQAIAGVDFHEIAKFLGHSDTEMVKRVYGHHHPDFMSKSARAVAF
jgi:integrase